MSFNIFNRVKVLVKKTYYISERYNLPATYALLYHEKPLNVIELSQFVRVSDQLIPLDENHYFIIFSFTTQDNAFKASQNLVQNLDKFFNNQTSCIALDTFNTTKSAQVVVNRLHQILEQTRKHSYVRVETEDILDH